MKDPADTICALSTAPGRSGIAVVRLSGPQSFLLFHKVFAAKRPFEVLPSRTAMLGQIVDPRQGLEIDEAMATCFPAPHSYTREDMIEFSLHGSPVLIAALLDSLCALGARLAEPGEFTMRAFLNGRIDLTQAEAVRDIIDATTLYQAQVAGRQRSGALAQQLRPVRDLLVDIIVNLESAVEFVEDDLSTASREILEKQLGQTRQRLREWIHSFRQGRIIRDGFSMAVIGRPNVGKSSVFNALLAQDRSIVTEVPGTTRDLVSEYTSIGGIPVRLQDTAGIHHSEDHIERLGMDRSLRAIADADAVLFVADTSRPPEPQDFRLKQQLDDLSCIAVMNKSDLASQWSPEDRKEFAGRWACVEVSAKTGRGIGELRGAILDGILGAGGISQDGIVITNLRHCHTLEAVEKDLAGAAAALQQGFSEEFVLIDLHHGLQKLGEITGETHVEELLADIFSRFCVGK
jgi:tRNA modification GTPase